MAGMDFVNTLLYLIPQYTGLSANTFIKIIAVVLGVFYLILVHFAPALAKYVSLEPCLLLAECTLLN